MKPLRSTEYYARLGAFAALVALMVTIVIAIFAAWRWYGQDFSAYYVAARVLLRGGNPYDFNQVIALTLELAGRALNNPLYYPLWALFPILPLATMPFQLARLLWIALNALVWIAGMWIVERALDWHPSSWARYLVWLGVFILFEWMTLRTEQFATWLFLDLAILLWAIRNQRDGLASAALALLLTKFSVTFLAFGVFFLLYLRTRKNIAIGAMGTLLLLIAISTLAVPGWWAPIVSGKIPRGWDQGLDGFEAEGGRMTSTTIDLIRYGFGFAEPVAWVTVACVAVVAMYCLWRWREDIFFVAMLATTFVFLITPYSIQYDYALLSIPFVWIVKRLNEVDLGAQAAVTLGTIFIASVLFWEQMTIDGLWIPITLTILLIITAPHVSSRASEITRTVA